MTWMMRSTASTSESTGFNIDNMFDIVITLYRTGIIDELHIDLCPNEKHGLFARMIERNAEFHKENNRFIVINEDNETILNIGVNDISSSMIKRYGDKCTEVAFILDGIRYRMFISGSKNYDFVCA